MYSWVDILLSFFLLVSSCFEIGCLHSMFETFGFFWSPPFFSFYFSLMFFSFCFHFFHCIFFTTINVNLFFSFIIININSLIQLLFSFCRKQDSFTTIFVSSWFCSPSTFSSCFSIFFSSTICCKKLLKLFILFKLSKIMKYYNIYQLLLSLFCFVFPPPTFFFITFI